MAKAPRKTPKDLDPATGLPIRPDEPAVVPGTDPVREAAALRLCLDAAKTLDANKCQDIHLLDLRGRSQVTDFFVIASGTSDRQMHSAADHVAQMAKKNRFNLYRSNLDEAGTPWVVLDFVDAVVHIFMPETRLYYDLEMLWGDAPRIDWKNGVRIEDLVGAGKERNRAGLKPGDLLPGRKRA